jgi:PepSY-associated TM region
MVKRVAIFVHRWLGVALCLLFLLWFPSGIGMMYWDFPEVTAQDRLARSPALDASTILFSPGEARAKAGAPPAAQIVLNTFDGRPVYRFRARRSESVVYADTGEPQTGASPELMRRVAAAWTRQPASAATIESIEQPDQWTVQGPLRNLRPLWKFSWPGGEQVYVAQRTGEVVQYTTSASRLGAYLGPIPHWIYFTPLRRNQAAWSHVVIWTSGIGTISALLGIAIGVWMYSPSKRYRRAGLPTSIPYRGQKRWHTVFGLIFGLGAASWAFSGMLSMDPFPASAGGGSGSLRRPAAPIADALRGLAAPDAFGARPPRDALAQLSPLRATQLELTSFAGEPVYLATLVDGGTRIVPMNGPPRAEFDHQRIAEIVGKAAEAHGGADVRVLDAYDAYYLDRRRERPLPVILAQLRDEERTRYYIDPKTASIVRTYSASGWVSRWLYHGLHSLDFPWLYNYRPLWDIVVIAFMLGGTALSVTSLVLAWRVIGRRLSRAGDLEPDAL